MLFEISESKLTAPKYSDNERGEPVWSGLHSDEFTEEITQSLRLFILTEAMRQGHNDARYERVQCQNMFHPDFLLGWPFELWAEKYQEGIESYNK